MATKKITVTLKARNNWLYYLLLPVWFIQVRVFDSESFFMLDKAITVELDNGN